MYVDKDLVAMDCRKFSFIGNILSRRIPQLAFIQISSYIDYTTLYLYLTAGPFSCLAFNFC